jgi:bifunctional DNase/RNase
VWAAACGSVEAGEKKRRGGACLGSPPVEADRKECPMLVEMKVKFLTFDSTSNRFVVLLMDLANKTGLPIWIGPFEANAIAMKLKKIAPQRPMTHDLIYRVLDTLGSRVSRIVVNDLKESTYFALIYLNRGSEEIVIDSRPSDAIAVALSVDAPIYVTEQVIEKSKTIDMEKDGDQLKEWLEHLDPDDFKYKA